MTAVICMALTLSSCARGGHAIPVPPRGGQATAAATYDTPRGLPAVSIIVRRLKRFTSWVCIHRHEGNWQDAGDPYWGGLQMDRGFMATYGPDIERRHLGGLANTWTPAEQIMVAERAYLSGRGFAPWPNTARACGVL